jgi:DNA repair protein RadC
MAVIYLSHKHRVQAIERVATGTLSSIVVHPREVFKGALLANASAIALVHNHPSGDPTPSEEDRELTKRVMQAGEILGIKVLDHSVLGETAHVSLRETTALWHQNLFHA